MGTGLRCAAQVNTLNDAVASIANARTLLRVEDVQHQLDLLRADCISIWGPDLADAAAAGALDGFECRSAPRLPLHSFPVPSLPSRSRPSPCCAALWCAALRCAVLCCAALHCPKGQTTARAGQPFGIAHTRLCNGSDERAGTLKLDRARADSKVITRLLVAALPRRIK